VSQPDLNKYAPAIAPEPGPSSELKHMDLSPAEALGQFTPAERAIIIKRFKSMQDIPQLIGKDFDMPIYIGKPGSGWYWNFKENYIVVDPAEILERPADESRFIIAHEGSHRRISLADTESPRNKEYFEQYGFPMLYNCIEDPRVNNFLTDKYQTFRTGMNPLYAGDHGFEAETKDMAEANAGFQPRVLQAGFEYIRQWVAETRGEHVPVRESLDPEVVEALEKTLGSARKAWWLYPSWQESQDPSTVRQYAEASLRIVEQDIWPHLKELAEADMKDAMVAKMLRKAMEEMAEGQENPESLEGLPEDIKQKIKEQLEEFATQQQESQKINLDDLPEELLEKLREVIDSLPEELKDKLQKEAAKILEELEKQISKKLQTKEGKEPGKEEVAEQEEGESQAADSTEVEPGSSYSQPPAYASLEEIEDYFADEIKEAEVGTKEYYDNLRMELEPIIDTLYNELNNIFIDREANKSTTGHRHGSRINVRSRIREKSGGVPVTETRAWERRDLPTQKDYAFSLLIDLSGSMSAGRGGGGETRIHSALKTAIVWAEVLGRLGIKFEVVGFNEELKLFKGYLDAFGDETRAKMAPMEQEVRMSGANYNDDGWALQEASERIEKQRASEKFVVVISDGQPAPSLKHSGYEYDLAKVVQSILNDTNQHVVGIGVQNPAVEKFYPDNVVIEDISELPKAIVEVIRRSIGR
jgi:hypothetical protein